jgi:hypothetical protein
MLKKVFLMTDDVDRVNRWNVPLAYCLISGEFFTKH